ncbi:DUF2946 domain-containing protein [Bradyrhizobium genosp. P]|uniref:DUF2946 domain-containing protein n=1 Tax=Bradyrhizobium genosp. P TaxID=83641 RepID=UPI003CEFF1A7
MKWFRANVRQGSRLALFALAIQFVLSFGHIHANHAQAAPSVARHVVHVTAMDARGAWHAIATLSVRSKTPSGHHSNDGLADDCPICAMLVLANAPLSATPPLLPARQAAGFAYLITNATSVDLNCVDAAFQPRAPPVV